jgi:3-methyladenine DNA glycosylase/8-oxoguanine DNA glycosylase
MTTATLAPDTTVSLRLEGPLDLVGTLAPLAHGRGDPTIRLLSGVAWRATRTPHGPATLRIAVNGDALDVAAWGPGADWAIDAAPGLIGLEDEPEAFVPRHALLADLARRLPGLRLPRTRRVFEALLPAICEQKITGDEARAVFRAIVRRRGEPAPGPGGLLVPPRAEDLAALPYFAYHPLGLERRRSEVVIRAAGVAERLEIAHAEEAVRVMLAMPGIGPWTAAEVTRVAHGDPDAVSIGDYHMPNLVAFALAGEARADDARMLELLEPYRGQRGRVQRLLEASGIRPPRYGPRMSPRRIAHL